MKALLSRNTPDVSKLDQDFYLEWLILKPPIYLLLRRQELHLNSSHEELDGDYKMDEPIMDKNMKMVGESSNIGWERQKAQSTSCLDLSSANPDIDRLR